MEHATIKHETIELECNDGVLDCLKNNLTIDADIDILHINKKQLKCKNQELDSAIKTGLFIDISNKKLSISEIILNDLDPTIDYIEFMINNFKITRIPLILLEKMKNKNILELISCDKPLVIKCSDINMSLVLHYNIPQVTEKTVKFEECKIIDEFGNIKVGKKYIGETFITKYNTCNFDEAIFNIPTIDIKYISEPKQIDENVVHENLTEEFIKLSSTKKTEYKIISSIKDKFPRKKIEDETIEFWDYVKICNNQKVQKINDFMRLYHLKTIDGTIVDKNNKQQILNSISETHPFEGFIKNVFIYKFGSKKYNL